MKTKWIAFGVFVVSLFLVNISCSNEDSVLADKMETSSIVNEDEAYRNLILYMEQMDPLYNISIDEGMSRGRFWSNLWRVLKYDGIGFKWGMNHGLQFKVSLIVAAVCSIVGVVLTAKESKFSHWGVYDDWQIITPKNEWERMGFNHNKIVEEAIARTPSITSGRVAPSAMLSSVESAASNLGFSTSLPPLYRTELLSILNSNNLSAYEAMLERASESSQIQFLDSYVQRIAQLSDKSAVHSYTQGVLDQIDNSNISDKNALKCIVCIFEHSRFLWNVVE